MCVGVPMQVIACSGLLAECRRRNGETQTIDLLLTGALQPGTWVLTHLGAAREVIDEVRAEQVGVALEALEDLLAGRKADLNAAFADLLDREPQLPAFLRGDPA